MKLKTETERKIKMAEVKSLFDGWMVLDIISVLTDTKDEIIRNAKEKVKRRIKDRG